MLTYLLPIVQVIVISGYYDIPAGGTLGPRYLAPVLPFLVLPAALGLLRFPRCGSVLAVLSVVLTGGATLIDVRLPVGTENRLFSYYAEEFWAGHFTHNLGQVLGLNGHWSLLPLFAVIVPSFCWLWRNLDAEKAPKA